MNTQVRSSKLRCLYKTKPTLEPGCLEAIAIARRAAGPRAVVPDSDNLSTRGKGKVTIISQQIFLQSLLFH